MGKHVMMKLRRCHPDGAMNVRLADGSVMRLTTTPVKVAAELVPGDVARLRKWVAVEGDAADTESTGETGVKQMPNAKAQSGEGEKSSTEAEAEAAAEKEAEKARVKAEKEAEKARAKAEKEAEKARKKAEKKAAQAKAKKAGK